VWEASHLGDGRVCMQKGGSEIPLVSMRKLFINTKKKKEIRLKKGEKAYGGRTRVSGGPHRNKEARSNVVGERHRDRKSGKGGTVVTTKVISRRSR